MDTQKLILFIVFSFSLLLLWDAWQKEQQPAPPAVTAPSRSEISTQAVPIPQQSAPLAQPEPQQPQEGLLQKGDRLVVQTDLVYAEIDTVGGDLRRLELIRHRDTEDMKKRMVLLTDQAPRTYVAQTGLIGPGLPSHKALFSAPSGPYQLAPGAEKLEVRLSWADAGGVRVDKIYTFHRNSYAVDVTYQIHNSGQAALAAHSYYQLLRDGTPPAGDPKFVATYTGVALYSEAEKFKKVSFPDMDKGKTDYARQSNNGWIGMLQHYFVSAWLPGNGQPREFYTKKLGENLYAAGVILPLTAIAPGTSRTVTVPLYAGPQEQDQLSKLAPGLDLTVDYGWLTVIAAPLFWVLSWIHKAAGNWGAAIILLTIMIKLAFYPLSAKSYRSMAQMRVLAPRLQKLKEQYGDDRQKLHQAMMDLYKTEKINPLGGCLPVVVQIPVFIALYWVLLASVEMRQAPFALWINDLSAPDPYYVLPIIMGISMIVQTKLNPTPPDPIQAKVMMIMPFAFSIFFFFFPAGLVLYWVVNNILSIAQQWRITRSLEQAHAAKGHAKR